MPIIRRAPPAPDPAAAASKLPEPLRHPAGALGGFLASVLGADDPASQVMLGPAALGSGVTSKVGRALTNPKDLELLQNLLGEVLSVTRNPSKLLRISSVDPAKGLARLHTSDGQRLASPVQSLLKALKSGVIDRSDYVDDIGAIGRMDSAGHAGERVPKLTDIGPRGGTSISKRRPIPPTATR